MKYIKYKNTHTKYKNWCIQITKENRDKIKTKITDLDSKMKSWPFNIGSYYGVYDKVYDGRIHSWGNIISDGEFNLMFNINDNYEIY